VHAAPAGLTAILTAAAAKAQRWAVSTLALVKAASKIVAWTKSQTVAAVAAAALATGTTAVW